MAQYTTISKDALTYVTGRAAPALFVDGLASHAGASLAGKVSMDASSTTSMPAVTGVLGGLSCGCGVTDFRALL
jgi:hypothetical protein